MNPIVFGREGGKIRRLLLPRKYACSAFLLASTLHLLWSILFIFCLLAPEGMNAIVFGERDEGEIRRLLLARKVDRQKIIFSLLASSKKKGDCHFTKNKVVIFRVILLRDVQHATYDTH